MMSFFPTGDSLIPYIITFFLVMVRVAFLFLTMPLFSAQLIPKRIRGAIIAVVSLAVFAALPESSATPLSAPVLVMAALGEASVGAAAGLAAQIVFGAVDGAGRLMGIPMGLGFSRAVDPLTGASSVVISRFFGAMIAFTFLITNTHHMLLRLITRSFITLPPGGVVPSPVAAHTLLRHAALIFSGAVQLAAPVILVLLGVMVTLGLLAKIAPKVNLFILSFAISIALGNIALRSSLPNIMVWIRTGVARIEPLALEVLGGF